VYHRNKIPRLLTGISLSGQRIPKDVAGVLQRPKGGAKGKAGIKENSLKGGLKRVFNHQKFRKVSRKESRDR